ncbi:MAG: T9SS type A sorting domain-containing protein [Flavobacteriaceae bacterium]
MIKKYLNISLLTLTLVSFVGFSQTGPGGVGSTDGTSNLALWLNADKETVNTTWSDQSGNGFDFTGVGTTFNSATANGYNSFEFTPGATHAMPQYFERAYEADLNTAEFSVFTASKVTASTATKTLLVSEDWHDISGTYKPGGFNFNVTDTAGGDFWSAVYGAQPTDALYEGYWINTVDSWAGQFFQHNAVGSNSFVNGELYFDTSTDANLANDTYTANAGQPMRVGANFAWDSAAGASIYQTFFEGEVGEVIVYKTAINAAQRVIIENYLAAKYGYILDSQDAAEVYDLYEHDNAANGNYDHNVAGIGMHDAAADTHLESQGTGIVKIGAAITAVENFLFWGEETKDATYDFSTSAQGTERLNSKWRVDDRYGLGAISTVSIAVADLDAAVTGDVFRLVVSATDDFAVSTTYPMTLSGGVYSVDNVDLVDDNYFTFEGVDTSSVQDISDSNSIKLIDNTDHITINSNDVIKNVQFYNMLGQQLISKTVNNTDLNLPVKLNQGQVILVKITLENGTVMTDKLIKK